MSCTSAGLLVLDDLNPRRLVSANRRIHHMVRAEVCAYWRGLGHQAITREYGAADNGETWHQAVRIMLYFRFPNLIRRDVMNLYPYVAKPLIDGMVDAKLIPDDNDRYLIGPDMRRDPERGPHRISIRIEETA